MAKKSKPSPISSEGRKVTKGDLTNVRTGLRDAFKKSDHRKMFVNKHKIKTPKYTVKGNLHKAPDVSYKCNDCEQMLKGAEIKVDHVKPIGTFKEADDIKDFFFKIFCSYDNLQILCDDCHDHKTVQDRKDIKAANIKANAFRTATTKIVAEGVAKMVKELETPPGIKAPTEINSTGLVLRGFPVFTNSDLSIGEIVTVSILRDTEVSRLVYFDQEHNGIDNSFIVNEHIGKLLLLGHDTKAIHCHSEADILAMIPTIGYPVETKTITSLSDLI